MIGVQLRGQDEHQRHDERDEDRSEQEHHGGHPDREAGV